MKIKLLKHQASFVKNITDRHLALVAGYGAGKTRAFIAKAFDLSSRNVGSIALLLEPTAPLLHDILLPEFESFLQEYEISYKIRKSPNINITIKFYNGETTLLLRSAENWQRLIGVNAAFIGIDEFDTMNKEDALAAYDKLQGRLRSGNVRQIFTTTTPESFNAAYELFEKRKIGKIIRASSYDNPFLPDDFLENLEKNYTEEQKQAYIHGIFCNITSGSVYKYFKRHLHNSFENPIAIAGYYETLHVGADFNIGGCVSIVLVERGDNWHVVDTIVSYDTYDTINNFLTKYGNHQIIFYPDASGQNRKTNASMSDIQMLKQHFEVVVDKSNPSVQDRVTAVNSAFMNNRLFINVLHNQELTESLEQHAYNLKTQAPEKFMMHPAHDDFNDALGYFVAKVMPVHRPKTNIKTVQEVPQIRY